MTDNATPQLIAQEKFPQMKYFILTSLIFLDFGILFGALNSFRIADVFNVPEIHQTHWTSTLFGAMMLLMMGQIYFMLANITSKPNTLNKFAPLIVIFTLIGIFGSYISVWIESQPYGDIFLISIKLAVLLYNILLFNLFRDLEFRERLSSRPSSYMLIVAVLWLDIAVLVFFGFERTYIPREFLTSFIYGFFSHTLFGTLGFVLPILFSQKPRKRSSVLRDTLMLSSAAILLVINEYLGNDAIDLFGLLGPVICGLVGFFFILYVFDLIYKTGFSASLIGLAVALVMFGFFVFDTFMNNIFPAWVTASHVHFMFLGTLVLTIVSIGSRLLVREFSGKESSNQDIVINSSKLYVSSIGLSVFFVVMILFMFTFQLYEIAGYMGLGLFVSMGVVEFSLLSSIRK